MAGDRQLRHLSAELPAGTHAGGPDLPAICPGAALGDLLLCHLAAFTYLFLPSTAGFGHILMNMLTLWMFGTALESVWGTRRFLQFYFFCGVGAGVCVIVLNALFGSMNTRTIGASGAI
ncbi:MAG: rhomboid family intramembrane serine protease [Bryobacterales bacterium]|nr:rhomboid family intramembrane serine protease [Bryobacterales bacterium]